MPRFTSSSTAASPRASSQCAFTIGCEAMAATIALAARVSGVRDSPVNASEERSLPSSSIEGVTSAVRKTLACGARVLATIADAICFRMPDGARRVALSEGACTVSASATSAAVTAPSNPLPVISLRSMPASRAARRAAGVAGRRSVLAADCEYGVILLRRRLGLSAAGPYPTSTLGDCESLGHGESAGSSIRMIGVPTGTVVPGSTRSSLTTPT